jgi:hypothetical protein
MEVSGQLYPGKQHPSKHCARSWLCPRIGVDDVLTFQGIEPWFLGLPTHILPAIHSKLSVLMHSYCPYETSLPFVRRVQSSSGQIDDVLVSRFCTTCVQGSLMTCVWFGSDKIKLVDTLPLNCYQIILDLLVACLGTRNNVVLMHVCISNEEHNAVCFTATLFISIQLERDFRNNSSRLQWLSVPFPMIIARKDN